MRPVESQNYVNIRVSIDYKDYEFLVISGAEEEEVTTDGFVILLNNTHIGSLRIAEGCYWTWIEGALGHDLAAAIGQGIENHYID